jgi:phosphate-selective porin OprO/OprP
VITDGAIQVHSRPEVNPSPYFVDTKKFNADYSTHFGGEFFYRKERLLVGAEYNIHMFHSPENNNPSFTGGEAFVSYLFTGEVRPYFSDFGIFGFIKVKKSIFKGGPGAFEGILRYTNLDLTDGEITGGEVWRLTPGLIWHASDHIKFFTSYGFIVLKQNNMEGKANVLQARIMYMI